MRQDLNQARFTRNTSDFSTNMQLPYRCQSSGSGKGVYQGLNESSIGQMFIIERPGVSRPFL